MNPEITNKPPQPTDSTDSKHSKHFESGSCRMGYPLGQSRPSGTTHSTDSKLNTLSSFIFYLSILFFIIGFNFSDVMVGNWYQQSLPDLGGRQINDITFTDSLIGYAVTSKLSNTSYILKTTNSGDNWSIIYNDTDSNNLTCTQFLNQNTGYVGGLIRTGFSYHILKTTNSGINWFNVSTPAFTYQADMHVLNEDTMWYAMDEISSGGVFRTTNGGVNWDVQYQGNNPSHIYMYDRNLGFISPPSTGALYRTTNSGTNWAQVTGENGFRDIYFTDSQTGWKANGPIKKTTDGGLNWNQQTLPNGGILLTTSAVKLSAINKDTLWAIGGEAFYGSGQFRGVIYRTTNGGNNWLFQIPDTSIHITTRYYHLQFINASTGWAYTQTDFIGGVHTTSGGDPVWLTGFTQISTEVPKNFMLYQNYPNPFNPLTKIKYQISNNKYVKVIVYDIQGKEIITLINKEQTAGTYEISFNGANYSSGIYFYSLIIDGKHIDTKKMLLVK